MAWLSGYNTRRKITIDHTKIDSDLTDFPVLVKLTSSNFDFSKANSDGYDIRFTEDDGTTLLKYERERHDSANQIAEYWVKIPSVSSSADTEFYIYYRTTDTADGADPTNVWDSNYELVTHMKDDPDTSHVADSTANNNDGTKKAANEPIEADGKIAKAQDFDGSNDYISCGTDIGLTRWTLEAWIKKTGAFNWDAIITKRPTTNSDMNYYFQLGDESATFKNEIGGGFYDGDWRNVWTDTDPIALDTYYYVVLTFDGTYLKIYVDGVLKKTSSDLSAYTPNSASTTPVRIGAEKDGPSDFFNGIIDEARISDIARSASWLKATYNSGNDTLVSYGSEEHGYLETLTETLGLTDTLQKTTIFSKVLTENLSLSDTIQKVTRFSKTLTEDLTLTDVVTVLKKFIVNLIETLNLSDALDKLTNFKKTISETLNLSDTVSIIKKFFVSLSETLHLSDAVSRVTKFKKTIIETLHLSDIVSIAGGWFKQIKHTTSWSKQTKHSTAWTKLTKHSTSWTNQTKH